MRAQHENAHRRMLFANLLERVHERCARHRHVEQHDVHDTGREPRYRLLPRGSLGSHVDAGILLGDPAQSRSYDRMIVGNEDANHDTTEFKGTRSSTFVPPRGLASILTVPPDADARSRSPSRPSEWRPWSFSAGIPRPSSITRRVSVP